MLGAVNDAGLSRHKARAISFASAAMKAGKIVGETELEQFVACLKTEIV